MINRFFILGLLVLSIFYKNNSNPHNILSKKHSFRYLSIQESVHKKYISNITKLQRDAPFNSNKKAQKKYSILMPARFTFTNDPNKENNFNDPDNSIDINYLFVTTLQKLLPISDLDGTNSQDSDKKYTIICKNNQALRINKSQLDALKRESGTITELLESEPDMGDQIPLDNLNSYVLSDIINFITYSKIEYNKKYMDTILSTASLPYIVELLTATYHLDIQSLLQLLATTTAYKISKEIPSTPSDYNLMVSNITNWFKKHESTLQPLPADLISLIKSKLIQQTPVPQFISKSLTQHTNAISCVAWRPHKKQFIAGSWEGLITLWTYDETQNEWTPEALGGHTTSVISLAWSPDGLSFISGSRDKTIRIWSYHEDSGWASRALAHHKHFLTAIEWSPDGSQFASASEDQTLRIWKYNDIHKGWLPKIIGSNCRISAITWSLDGSKIISGLFNGSIMLWNYNKKIDNWTAVLLPLHHRKCILSIKNFDGSQFISASDDATLRHWTYNTINKKWNSTIIAKHTAGITCFQWKPASDDSQSPAQFIFGSWDGTIKIYTHNRIRNTWSSQNFHQEFNSWVLGLSYNSDHSQFVAGAWDGTIKIWTKIDYSDLPIEKLPSFLTENPIITKGALQRLSTRLKLYLEKKLNVDLINYLNNT